MTWAINDPIGTQRILTGVPRLDEVLGGGLVANGLYIVQGPPGTGKTILGNQICFHCVKNGGRAAYVTLLAESVSRMVQFLHTMEFFDRRHVGNGMQYLSAYHALRDKGLSACQDLLRKAITEQNINIMVVDGADSLRLRASSDLEYREFLHSMQTLLSLKNSTILLLAPINVIYPSTALGHTIVDGIIELSLGRIGPRTTREIEVVKVRGSGFLQGRHEFEITNQGITLHPRIEIRYVTPSTLSSRDSNHRMKFGVQKLDGMLHGGLLIKSATVLMGPPGTGKTSLGMSFLAEGANLGQLGYYLGFHEIPPVLIENCESIGIQIREPIKKNMIELEWYQQTEHIADALAEKLLEKIRAKKGQPCRVFIDGLTGFRAALPYPSRFTQFLAALLNELRSLNVTVLIAEEVIVDSTGMSLPMSVLGSISDNVILLRYFEYKSQLARFLVIIKTRGASFEPEIREFTISSKGIEFQESMVGMEQTLTGQPRGERAA